MGVQFTHSRAWDLWKWLWSFVCRRFTKTKQNCGSSTNDHLVLRHKAFREYNKVTGIPTVKGENVVVKVKLSLCLTKSHVVKTCPLLNSAPRHEDLWVSGGIAPRILNLGTRWRWVVSFAPQPLYPQGKSPRFPLVRRLGGPQSRSGWGGEQKDFFIALCRKLKPGLPTRSIVIILTEPLRFLLNGRLSVIPLGIYFKLDKWISLNYVYVFKENVTLCSRGLIFRWQPEVSSTQSSSILNEVFRGFLQLSKK